MNRITILITAAAVSTGAATIGAGTAHASPTDVWSCAVREQRGLLYQDSNDSNPQGPQPVVRTSTTPLVAPVDGDVSDHRRNSGYGDPTHPNGLGWSGVTVNLPDTGLSPLDNITDRQLGTYTLWLRGTCVHIDIDNSDNTRAGTVSIYSQGSYADTICGTGSMWSVRDQTSFDIASGGDADTINSIAYYIHFVAGQGVLAITDATATDGQNREVHTTSPAGGGFMDVIPAGADPVGDLWPQDGDCVVSRAKYFDVTGAFTLAA